MAKRSHDPQLRPVLVVEDDAGVRAYLAAVLEHQGYTVIAVESGEEALAAIGTVPPQLAVLDVGLPGMDGFAVAEKLGGDVPVIIVTGDPDRAQAEAFGRDPAIRVLGKPLAPDQFERAVAEAL
jgi:two-component system response regulator TctD